jgi:D-glycero-alpha-D-manno-heptose 1-phosphate guanylyltransferase
MEAIILAGGQGTRLRKAVPDVPKPIAPVSGVPFLRYLIGHWSGQGVRRFVLSVGFQADRIIDTLGERIGPAEIAYARETEPLDTGGGIALAVTRLRDPGPFLVLNGDTFFGIGLTELVTARERDHAAVCVALAHVPCASRYSLPRLGSDGRIAEFAPSERTQAAGWVNAGAYCCDESIRRSLPAAGTRFSFEREFLPQLIASGTRVFTVKSPAIFIDIGVPEDYARAAQVIPGASRRTAKP